MPNREIIQSGGTDVLLEKKSTKVNKANRTAIQFLVALVASGTLVVMWQALTASAAIDPALVAIVTPFLIWLVSYAQNAAEENGWAVPGLTKSPSDEVRVTVKSHEPVIEPQSYEIVQE